MGCLKLPYKGDRECLEKNTFFGKVCLEKNPETQKKHLREYHYHLTDHLGNVRVMLTSKPDTIVFLATMETENIVEEDELFDNINRFTETAANNTPGGDEAVVLFDTQPMGPGIGLAVGVGDEIDLEVYGYYNGGTGYSNTLGVDALISAIATGFGGATGAGATETQQAIYNTFDNSVGAIGLLGTSNDNVPAAYINYILFDENMAMYLRVRADKFISRRGKGTTQYR